LILPDKVRLKILLAWNLRFALLAFVVY